MMLRLLVLVLGPLLASSPAVAAAKTPPRPNVLLIVADDLGYSDLGCYGSEIETPHLDRLAQDGIRFTQFYNATRCSPSRAALLTGLYSHRTKVAEAVGYLPRPPEYLPHLGPGTVTLAELLRAGGYRTLMSGKWHLGEDRPHWPIDRGFEQSFTLIDAVANYFGSESFHEVPGKQKWTARFVTNEAAYVPPREGFYATDAFADQAIRLFDEHTGDDKPFFMYLAFTAPHWPLHALPEDIAKYRGRYKDGWDRVRLGRFEKMRKLGIIERRWKLPAREAQIPAWDDLPDAEKAQWESLMEVHAAMIDRMDQAIGRVLAKIDGLGKRDDTLVMFLSDNGASGEQVNLGRDAPPGDRRSYLGYGIPWATVSNTPFRLYKKSVHEGGISTPFIVTWPRGIKRPGRLHHGAAHLIDVVPTVTELAGVHYPKTFGGGDTLSLDGTSLTAVLRGATSKPDRRLYWEHWGDQAVRDGRWKLVRRNSDDWELYDMTIDRTETNDLARRKPAHVRRLAAMFDVWSRQAGVVVPYPFPAKRDAIRQPPW